MPRWIDVFPLAIGAHLLLSARRAMAREGDDDRMGEMAKLKTKDGVTIDAYMAKPAGAPKGGVVVLQEIFGVTPHIRSVADRYATQGYLAVAPALFDRVQANYESGYGPDDVKAGMATRAKTELDKTMLDVEAAIAEAAKGGKVGVVGFCWGGFLAFNAACKTSGVSAAVGYYGGGIAGIADQTPKAPTMLHFGENDPSIPMTDVQKIQAARPDVEIFVYKGASHAFNRDGHPPFVKEAADLAGERTAAFFAKHLA